MKVVANRCFGGFGLSDMAYEKLIEWGVPVRAYVEQERDPTTGLYLPQPANDGEVIFDRDLTPPDKRDKQHDLIRRIGGRYWEAWIRDNRSHPLLVRVVELLGELSYGKHAKLEVVEIPDGIEWEIDEYDGNEVVREKHRSW